MFMNIRVRSAMKNRIKKSLNDRRDSPRFETPLFIRKASGEFQERYGRVGIGGFYFETDVPPRVGQLLDVKLILHGLGIELQTRGRVIGVYHMNDFTQVAARFEEITFEAERMLARWLDLLVHAQSTPAAA